MYFAKVLPLVFSLAYAAPNLRLSIEQAPAQLLTLPSNATSIRSDISDSFSCEGRDYGYYADVENDCQLFHVCLPVTYANGRQQTFRWSFICPDETVFNQEMFTCTRSDEALNCDDSPRFYSLNKSFGDVLNTDPDQDVQNEDVPFVPLASIAPVAPVVPAASPAPSGHSVLQVDDATSVPEVPQAIEEALEQRHPIGGLRRSRY
nr:uncharacterized protein LOC111420944 [Onthophagus taurus]